MKPITKALSLGIALLLSVLISIPALAVSVPYEVKEGNVNFIDYDILENPSNELLFLTDSYTKDNCLLDNHNNPLPYMPDPNLSMNIRNVLLICGTEYDSSDAFYFAASEAVNTGKIKEVTSVCSADGHSISKFYNYSYQYNQGRLKEIIWLGENSSKSAEISYDSNGNITLVDYEMEMGHATYKFHYKNNQLSSYDYYSLGYYDKKNVPLQFDDAGRVTKSFLASYQYDEKGRLTTIQCKGKPNLNIKTVYTYDNQDRVIKSVINNYALNETDTYTYRYTDI